MMSWPAWIRTLREGRVDASRATAKAPARQTA
jgi:hypothetical protein